MDSTPFVLSVKVIIRNRVGQCLLIRRSNASRHGAGQWDFPGGKLDPGERFDEGLIREVSEETGLRIQLTRLVGCADSLVPDRTVIYIIMEARLLEGQLQLSSEHTDATWVDASELTNMELCEQFRRFAREFAVENP
jgi:8-oxo-dGTP diphosphatase